MSANQFKYSFTESGLRGDKIPFIEIRVANKDTGKAINYIAMVDSGAFMNVFHTEIAEVLGIDLTLIKEEISFGGVKEAKKMTGKACFVELMVTQKGKSYKFDAYVLFSNEVATDGYPLLGRIGFFNEFDEVVFNFKKNKFYLKNY